MIGNYIKKIRESKKISLAKLSELSGVAKSTIYDIEKNNSQPSMDKVLKICNALDVPPYELVDVAVDVFIGGHMEQVLKNAIDKFGLKTQIDIAIEEMAELTQALSKFKRGKEHNVEEEIADVKIMLKQLELKFDKQKIDSIEKQKIQRLEKLIKA